MESLGKQSGNPRPFNDRDESDREKHDCVYMI